MESVHHPRIFYVFLLLIISNLLNLYSLVCITQRLSGTSMSPASLGTGIIEDVRAKCARDGGLALMGLLLL